MRRGTAILLVRHCLTAETPKQDRDLIQTRLAAADMENEKVEAAEVFVGGDNVFADLGLPNG